MGERCNDGIEGNLLEDGVVSSCSRWVEMWHSCDQRGNYLVLVTRPQGAQSRVRIDVGTQVYLTVRMSLEDMKQRAKTLTCVRRS